MLNSVHEPGSNGDSKTSPSRKPGRKTKPGARAPSWPSWHAQVRTGAPSRLPRAPLRAPCAYSSAARFSRLRPRPVRCRAPPAARPGRPAPHARAACQRPAHACAVPARPSACCHAQPSAHLRGPRCPARLAA